MAEGSLIYYTLRSVQLARGGASSPRHRDWLPGCPHVLDPAGLRPDWHAQTLEGPPGLRVNLGSGAKAAEGFPRLEEFHSLTDTRRDASQLLEENIPFLRPKRWECVASAPKWTN